MAEEIEDQIQDNALAPKKVEGDAGSAEQHSIPDQIAAARFAASNRGVRSGLGIRYVKLRMPGAIDLNNR